MILHSSNRSPKMTKLISKTYKKTKSRNKIDVGELSNFRTIPIDCSIESYDKSMPAPNNTIKHEMKKRIEAALGLVKLKSLNKNTFYDD